MPFTIAADYEKIFYRPGMRNAPLEVMQAFLFSFWKIVLKYLKVLYNLFGRSG
jgi:hypothetical protein